MTPVKRDVERVEREIETLSREIAAIEAQMADPAFYQEGARFAETLRSYHALKETVETKTRRWEELLLRLEQLERELSADT
jgi:ATP-binding cassette subfamily F protein 3